MISKIHCRFILYSSHKSFTKWHWSVWLVTLWRRGRQCISWIEGHLKFDFAISCILLWTIVIRFWILSSLQGYIVCGWCAQLAIYVRDDGLGNASLYREIPIKETYECFQSASSWLSNATAVSPALVTVSLTPTSIPWLRHLPATITTR